MAKAIKRINETGQAVEIVNQPSQPDVPQGLTDAQVLAACLKLGQSPEEAANTTQLYIEEALDPSDIKLIIEAWHEIEKEAKQQHTTQQFAPQHGAGIDARNPKRLKQRVTRRDPVTHEVIAIEDV